MLEAKGSSSREEGPRALSSMGVGRENARRAGWEVLKPPTSPCQADPEHPNQLGREPVLGTSVQRGELLDRVGVLWFFEGSQRAPGCEAEGVPQFCARTLAVVAGLSRIP